MGVAYRFPVLVWQDQNNRFTAKLIEYEHNFYIIYGGKILGDADRSPVGFGETVDDAVYQIKEYLAWSYEKYPWQDAPDFLEAKVIQFKVLVRPEYRVQERVFPADEQVPLMVTCVYGHQESGVLVASLPVLNIHFYYYDAKMLKELVHHYVQERLKALTPQELSRFLPPQQVQLETIVLNVSLREKKQVNLPQIKTLTEVAEAMGEKGFRRRYIRAWEREKELNDLNQRITQERANIILVGESGSGKTTLLVEAVNQMERGLWAQQDKEEKEKEENYRFKFWLTNGSRLIAGMQYLGQWEERCEQVISELSDIQGILCVDHVLDLLRNGGTTAVDSIASFLMPYLQRGEVRIIAEATPEELDACRRLLPGFVDLFQILKVPPFSKDKALAVLNRAATTFKPNYRLEMGDNVPDLIYRLYKRFLPYQVFPGKTVKFLQELFERTALEKLPEVSMQRTLDQFIKQTGLPELFLRDDLPLDHHQLVKDLAQRIIGQPEACKMAAEVITTFKAGLNDPTRPVAVMLFCGPTGVGKTELAKLISKTIFGAGEEKERLIRLDMSEYSGPGSADRLLGNPDGEPSALIKRVRQQPFVVLLLDEIEKADAQVFDMLLGLFDEGRLTDRYGRTTIFRSAIIIMTSNIGADKLLGMGFNQNDGPSYNSEIMNFFRPEFYNRIDAIVKFSALDRDMMVAITVKELSEIGEREGIKAARLKLNWSTTLIEYLSRTGCDVRYGARPLQRTIENAVVSPLAKFLLANSELRDVLLKCDWHTQNGFTIEIVN